MKNIVFIGMSGVGKSEIGKFVAEFLKWDFVDLDELIVEREKQSINDIFSQFGEEYFRNIESKITEEISHLENTVISTGGGIVIRPENIEHLHKNGYIILLMGKIQTIVDNLNKSSELRPLLKKDSDIYANVEKLFNSRVDRYILSSDVLINIDDKSFEELSKEVLIEYEKLDKIYN